MCPVPFPQSYSLFPESVVFRPRWPLCHVSLRASLSMVALLSLAPASRQTEGRGQGALAGLLRSPHSGLVFCPRVPVWLADSCPCSTRHGAFCRSTRRHCCHEEAAGTGQSFPLSTAGLTGDPQGRGKTLSASGVESVTIPMTGTSAPRGTHVCRRRWRRREVTSPAGASAHGPPGRIHRHK